MPTTMNRQDLQNLLEWYKNRLVQRFILTFPTKQDVLIATDQLLQRITQRLQELHMENQLMIKQSATQRDQLWRKAVSTENRMQSLETELRTLRQAMVRISEDQQRIVTILSAVPGLVTPVAQGGTQPRTIFQYSNA